MLVRWTNKCEYNLHICIREQQFVDGFVEILHGVCGVDHHIFHR